MKYLIILGRNIELSVKEVESYLIRINNPLLSYKINKNAILIEVKDKLNNIIENLGGVIAIGEILASGKIEEITNDLSGKELYLGQKNKFNYVLWNYSKEKIDEISIYLKQKFRFEKLKAIGIDKDREAIKGANQNLSWAKFNRENYLLINNDSSSVNIEKANVIATEPNLGDILKKIPTKEKAQYIQEGFEN